MTKPTRVSYVFIVVTLVVVAWLHLATPLITVLFGYFALSKLSFGGRKWIASCLFIILVFAIFYGFVFFLKAAFATLPDIASTSIPLIIQYARQHGLEMPFTDLDGLKVMALETVKDELRSLGNFAKFATKVTTKIQKTKVKANKVKRTIRGKIAIPAHVTKAQACTGKVTVQIKRRGRSVLNQQVSLSKSCTFSRSVIAARGKQSFSVTAKFGGNTVLKTASQTRRFS